MTALITVGLLWTMARVGEDRQAPTPTGSVLFWDDRALSVISPDGRLRARLVSGGPLDNNPLSFVRVRVAWRPEGATDLP